jgi:hypothetical protein
MPVSALAPLGDIPTARFYSLQKGRPAMQARSAPLAMEDFTSHLADFADTAAMIDRLDLVISVDTAVAHLAGALGTPVWTLLPATPHWHYGMSGPTTPWYPTMRLFRQRRRGDWNEVASRVTAALSAGDWASRDDRIGG